jgi:dienelactone hydrolase
MSPAGTWLSLRGRCAMHAAAAPVFALALSVLPLATLAQGSETAGFLVLVGTDTVAVERFTRTPRRLEAELTDRIQFYRQTYALDLSPDASVTHFVLSVRPAAASAESTPAQHVAIEFRGDSAIAQVGSGANAKTQRLAVPRGAVPFVNLSFSLVEQTLRRARALGGDDVAVPLTIIANGQSATMQVKKIAGDSAVLILGGTELRASMDVDGRLLAASVPAQRLTVRRVSAAASLSATPPKRDYSAPANAPYMAHEVRIEAPGGHVLAGTLTLPKSGAGPFPAVVTITGSGPQDRDESLPSLLPGYALFRQVADTLARRGIAVLRLDDRGIGESTGDYRTATSADFADDVRTALAYLRARSDIDGNRLALVGHSEGAIIAPMIAGKDTTLKGMVLMAGTSRPGREVMKYQMRYAVENDPAVPVEKRDSAAALAYERMQASAATVPWVKFFLDYDPARAAQSVRVPVLLLQGAKDWQVLPAQAEELAAAFRRGGNSSVMVEVFPELNHLFLADASGNPADYASLKDTDVSRAVLGRMADWLAARLAR